MSKQLHRTCTALWLTVWISLAAGAMEQAAAPADRLPGQDLQTEECFLCRVDLVEPIFRFRLPEALREASGLGVDEKGLIFIHNDEEAAAFGFSLEHLTVLEDLTVSRKNVFSLGDFEGIEIIGDRIILLRSDGHLLFATRPGHPDYPQTSTQDLGTGLDYELEGLGHHPDTGHLIVAVKTIYDKADPRGLVVFKWNSIESHRVGDEIAIDKSVLEVATGKKRFRASGVIFDTKSRHYVAVSAKDRLLLEFTEEGKIVRSRALIKSLHRQAEGIALGIHKGTPVLLIVDESDKTGGVLTGYRVRAGENERTD